MDELDLGQTIRGFAAGQKLFDRYTLKAVLGRGGMGIVWRAFDEQLERDVALKFLPELLVLDKAAMDELKRETKRSLELTHHHIVRIYDFAQDSRSACISMEYVDGQTLSALRVEKENKVFEAEELAPLVEQACDALQYAHVKAKIVHRDLKPANLMLNSRGELKVTDFGIARSLSDSVSMLSMRTSGTLVYMSPQQLDGERANPTDDVYSLGATIYELLTSKPPFYSGGIERQIHEKIPPSMAARRSELSITSDKIIPAEWEKTVAACLAKDPALRPQSAGEAAQRLGLTVPNYGKPTAVTSVVAPADVVTKSKPANRKLAVSAAALILLIVGGALGWYFGVYAPKEGANKAEATRVATQRAEEEAKAKAAEHAANARGAVLINTDPQGATVTLGDEKQKSPATFNNVKVGKLPLKVTLENCEPVEQQIEVKENEIANHGVIKLVRSNGTAQIDTTPEGIEFDLVDADGKHYTGKTPMTLTEISAGTAKIIYKPEKLTPYTESVAVAAHQSSMFTWKVPEQQASVVTGTTEAAQGAATPEPRKSFAGTWSGTTHGRSSVGDTSTAEDTYRVSADETTITAEWAEHHTNGQTTRGTKERQCHREGDVLSWGGISISEVRGSVGSKQSFEASLTITGPNTVRYNNYTRWLTGPHKGVTVKGSGTLYRQ